MALAMVATLTACVSVPASVPASPPASSSVAPASAATPAPAAESARPAAAAKAAGKESPANPSADAEGTAPQPAPGEPSPSGTTFIAPGAAPAESPAPRTGDGSRPPQEQGGGSGSGSAPASPRVASPGLTLSVVVLPAAARVGETLSVEVGASSGAGVVDAPLHVQYDPDHLRFLEASEGDFMNRDGAATVFLVNARSRPGDVLIGVGRTNRARGAFGRGALCTVRFEVLASGSSRIALGPAMAWGADGALVPVTLDALEIETLP